MDNGFGQWLFMKEFLGPKIPVHQSLKHGLLTNYLLQSNPAHLHYRCGVQQCSVLYMQLVG